MTTACLCSTSVWREPPALMKIFRYKENTPVSPLLPTVPFFRKSALSLWHLFWAQVHSAFFFFFSELKKSILVFKWLSVVQCHLQKLRGFNLNSSSIYNIQFKKKDEEKLWLLKTLSYSKLPKTSPCSSIGTHLTTRNLQVVLLLLAVACCCLLFANHILWLFSLKFINFFLHLTIYRGNNNQHSIIIQSIIWIWWWLSKYCTLLFPGYGLH